MKKFIFYLWVFFLLWSPFNAYSWGFYAHKKINQLAVFTLPPEMLRFYKFYIDEITESSVNPDKRRYSVKEEACRHFIDLDAYPDSIRFHMPKFWREAVNKFSEDTLLKYGIVPWHIYKMKFALTQAFIANDINSILKLSSEIGHYIADAHVPLHTTRNYNGQLTGQHGIHGFWESRLPELFSDQYNFFVGKATYLEDVQHEIWTCVYTSHQALDSVLSFENKLNKAFPSDKKFAFEERGGTTVRVFSEKYSKGYHEMLNNQVERRMQQAVKMIGNIWYTAWVDAGQPILRFNSERKPDHKQMVKEVEHENCSDIF